MGCYCTPLGLDTESANCTGMMLLPSESHSLINYTNHFLLISYHKQMNKNDDRQSSLQVRIHELWLKFLFKEHRHAELWAWLIKKGRGPKNFARFARILLSEYPHSRDPGSAPVCVSLNVYVCVPYSGKLLWEKTFLDR